MEGPYPKGRFWYYAFVKDGPQWAGDVGICVDKRAGFTRATVPASPAASTPSNSGKRTCRMTSSSGRWATKPFPPICGSYADSQFTKLEGPTRA
jgi:hypothetical protein